MTKGIMDYGIVQAVELVIIGLNLNLDEERRKTSQMSSLKTACFLFWQPLFLVKAAVFILPVAKI